MEKCHSTLSVLDTVEMNQTIHQTVRLRIMALLTVLDPNQRVEFTYLRNRLQVSDGNLGAHLRKLEDAGYVEMKKTFSDRKPRTYVAVTSSGQHAFAEHVAELADILAGAERDQEIA